MSNIDNISQIDNSVNSDTSSTKYSMQESKNILQKYSDKEIQNIQSEKIIVAKNDNDIPKFVNETINKTINAKLYLEKIQNKISNFVKNKFSIDITNYNLSLKTDAIKHT